MHSCNCSTTSRSFSVLIAIMFVSKASQAQRHIKQETCATQVLLLDQHEKVEPACCRLWLCVRSGSVCVCALVHVARAGQEHRLYCCCCGGAGFICLPPVLLLLPPCELRPLPRPRPLLPCCWRGPTSWGGRKWGACEEGLQQAANIRRLRWAEKQSW